MRRPLGALVLALALGACGGETPRGVEVTESTESALPPPGPRRSAAFDTVYADSGLWAGALDRQRLDGSGRDSLRQDSARQDPPEPPADAAPDFRTFWPRFRDAARAGRAPAAALASFSEAMSRDAFDRAFEVALGDPFRDGVLALTPRDFRRAGTAREAAVTVGYDAGGRVVPQDEAVTEARATLRFDVVDGAYRLVGLSTEP